MRVEKAEKKRGCTLLTLEGGEKVAFDPAASLVFDRGDEASSEALEANEAFNYSYGLLRALKYLARARTQSDVQSYLKKIGIQAGPAAKIMAYLKEARYVDDEEYAKLYRMSRTEEGLSQREITRRLIGRGIDKKTASVPAEAAAEADRGSLASLFSRIAMSSPDLPPALLKQKCYERAISKGFSYELAREAAEAFDFPSGGDYSAYYRSRIRKRLAAYLRRGFSAEEIERRIVSEMQPYGLDDESCYVYISEIREELGEGGL